MTEPDGVPAADGSPVTFSEPDEEWQRDLHGLLHIGRLHSTFDYLGHKIRIRTLRIDEELMAATLAQEWAETVGGTKALATAMCALAVEAVDGKALPTPLGEDTDPVAWARERFAYAQRWYSWTMDEIYGRYLQLEARVREILDAMGKASGRAGVTPGLSGSSRSPAPPAS